MKLIAVSKCFLAIILSAMAATSMWYASKQYLNHTIQPSDFTDADTVLNELLKGNDRFMNCCRTHSTDTKHDAEYRLYTAQKQVPLAAILCCSDSRVCPEFIFDQRSGKIFEIRNAGNVVDEDVLASMEYAVEHLHVPVIIVLGHKGCGAIQAVCQAGEKPLHNHLRDLQLHMLGIRPHVLKYHHKQDPEMLDHLAQENAKQQSLIVLRDSPVIKEAVENGKCRLLYGIYNMKTGQSIFYNLNP